MKLALLFIKRGLVTLAIVSLLAIGLVGWIGSSRLLTPERRQLQDYHEEILGAPADFGVEVTRHAARSGTPYLEVMPASHPGRARKSRALRTALSHSSISLPPWGQTFGTVILLHGHGSRKEDHLPISERFCAAGFRCILPDLPGHGESPLASATFGAREVGLIEELTEEVQRNEPHSPMFLFGISQGGAIAILTAARDPDRWAGVVSVAAFSSLDRVVLDSARSLHPVADQLSPLLYHSVATVSRLRVGLNPAAIRPVNAASRLTLPSMIVHGDSDHYIPLEQGLAIFERIPSEKKQFYTVAGGNHGRVLAKDSVNLYPAICAFMLDALEP
ncbi:alpha/beta hydrolase [Haloferula rosea]|uniref:Alpha/beta fold hydrolase n=1 Tax=Haloferula rosea TaxID=490093 RepID=A0A934RB34_9BACT|nr:alpha/beta fold hydrolase [Haloferula rosea]MBK1826074.1 alpha/beta fold hydrolase [Haloferula rosea]